MDNMERMLRALEGCLEQTQKYVDRDDMHMASLHVRIMREYVRIKLREYPQCKQEAA